MSDVEITIVKFRSYMMPNDTVCDATWRTLRYPGSKIDVHEIYWTQGNSDRSYYDQVVTYDPLQAGVEYAAMCDRLSAMFLGLPVIDATPDYIVPDNYGSW